MSSEGFVCVVEALHVGVGCNVESGCLDWSAHTGLVAYGARLAVAIMCPTRNIVLATLPTRAPVTQVRWLPGTSTLFAACSVGLVVVRWDHVDRHSTREQVQNDASVATHSVDHVSETSCFHGLTVLANGFGAGRALVALSGSHLAVFEYGHAARTCAQVGLALALPGRRLSECVAAALLPRSPHEDECAEPLVVLAVGGTDNRVHLYVNDASCHASNPGRLGYVAWLEGHDDLVRSLDWSVDEATGDALLASASHDHFIRLWRVSRYTAASEQHHAAESVVAASERQQRVVFGVNDAHGNVPRFSVGLDALLIGHSHWVQSVRWHGPTNSIVSASMDKTVIVWARDPDEGVWLDRNRVGEIGGQALGFYGAVFSPDGASLMGHSFNGSLHMWRRGDGAPFVPVATVSGHTDKVVDVTWDPAGRYLVSASADETVRLWVPSDASRSQWMELARPQIHGHALNAAAMLPVPEHVLVTGGDEKAVRVFSATAAFVASLRNVAGFPTEESAERTAKRPFGASLPPLGLSNKPLMTPHDAVVQEEARMEEAFGDEMPRAAPVVLQEAPVETLLAQSTLWPEDKKLYGHGAELFSLAASHDGTLLASACKGKAKPHTDVLLWRTSDWTLVGRLSAHKMTVTRIAFSHSDRFIATVSRDLMLCLWVRVAPGAHEYRLASKMPKVHSRIIWDCAWAPDDELLATASRDKRALLWRVDALAATLTQQFTLFRAQPQTSCAFVPLPGPHQLALGTESGALSLWTAHSTGWRLARELPTCGLTVTRLAFQRVPQSGSLLLASACADSSVRIHRVVLTTHFEQLCALTLSVRRGLGFPVPKPVIVLIWRFLRVASTLR